ncbi:MAG: hypothetical protein M3Y81_24090 [Chloroflexota bacterium]|nr:hypothetical protein [Chloroflexota bacterium]
MRQITGILLLAAGWGWSGGNFVPEGSALWIYLVHTIPFLILLVLCFGFLCVPDAPQRTRSMRSLANIGLNIFAAGSCIVLPVGVILGATNPDPNAYGIRTVADWVPIVILLLGAVVWLTTLIHARQGQAETVNATVTNAETVMASHK